MLRYGVVLAEGAPQVASEAADGKHILAGMEERNRLLLDRVERERRYLAVVRRDDASANGFAGAAESGRAVLKPAAAGTSSADDGLHLIAFHARIVAYSRFWCRTPARCVCGGRGNMVQFFTYGIQRIA